MPPASAQTPPFSPNGSALVHWLVAPATRALAPERFITELSARVIAAGVPLWRMASSSPTQHPELYVRNLRWDADEGAQTIARPYEILASAAYTESPVAEIHRGAGTIHARLVGAGASQRYELYRDLAARGGTDYVIAPLVLADGTRTYVSWATKHADGFTDAHIALLEEIAPALAMWLELDAARFTTRNLLAVYLGRNAAERVVAGAFRRGTGESLRAAIWFCDMRGFTTLADRTAAADVVATLDRFFERVAGPIEQRGGEVLKFVGDAVLAIFPLEGEETHRDTCARALAAAEDALAGVDALNAEREGLPPLAIGIALHVGEVMYGNIGARDRLDFTVIGAAVNEVCRVESLCKALRAPVLLTNAFTAALGGADVVSLGAHALKGVSAPCEVFAPKRFAPQ